MISLNSRKVSSIILVLLVLLISEFSQKASALYEVGYGLQQAGLQYDIPGTAVAVRHISSGEGILLYHRAVVRFKIEPRDEVWRTGLPEDCGYAEFLNLTLDKKIAMVGTNKGCFLWYSTSDGKLLGRAYYNHLEMFADYPNALALRTQRWAYMLSKLSVESTSQPQGWHFDFRRKLKGLPVIDRDGNLYVTSEDDQLHVVRNGKYIAKFKFGHHTTEPSLLADGTVGICSARGAFFIKYIESRDRPEVIRESSADLYRFILQRSSALGNALMCIGKGGAYFIPSGNGTGSALIFSYPDYKPFSDYLFYAPFQTIRERHYNDYKVLESLRVFSEKVNYDINNDELVIAHLKIWKKSMNLYKWVDQDNGKRFRKKVEEYERYVGVLGIYEFNPEVGFRYRIFILYDLPRYNHYGSGWLLWQVLGSPLQDTFTEKFWRKYNYSVPFEAGVIPWLTDEGLILILPSSDTTRVIKI